MASPAPQPAHTNGARLVDGIGCRRCGLGIEEPSPATNTHTTDRIRRCCRVSEVAVGCIRRCHSVYKVL